MLTLSRTHIEAMIDRFKSDGKGTLARHEPFSKLRKTVTPEDNHLFFFYIGLGSVLDKIKIDPSLRDKVGAIGFLDITAIGGALSENCTWK